MKIDINFIIDLTFDLTLINIGDTSTLILIFCPADQIMIYLPNDPLVK